MTEQELIHAKHRIANYEQLAERYNQLDHLRTKIAEFGMNAGFLKVNQTLSEVNIGGYPIPISNRDITELFEDIMKEALNSLDRKKKLLSDEMSRL